MQKTTLQRLTRCARKTSLVPRPVVYTIPNLPASRCLSITASLREKDDPYHQSSTAAPHGTSAGAHEGSASRTDNQIQIDYPPDHEMPSSAPVQGRGGFHLKRTLPSFSLENRVAVITGGARGLGLVMGQAIVESGADLAIVDLNSTRPGIPLHLY